MNINTKVRAGHLSLHGHYSNLSHCFTIIGQTQLLRAKYEGEEKDVEGGLWHKFFVPALELHVYSRRVDSRSIAFLAE